ncbi:MAG: hypothetical protein RJA98_3011 [Pseudomonadota bacterium]|jgi:hypothetical protein
MLLLTFTIEHSASHSEQIGPGKGLLCSHSTLIKGRPSLYSSRSGIQKTLGGESSLQNLLLIMPIEKSQDADLKESIENFAEHVRSYQRALKLEGTWLLLATLGCWSVTSQYLQWFAYIIVLLVFIDRMRERTGDTRSFDRIAGTIDQQINSSLASEDTKKARLWDLKQVQTAELGAKVSTRRNILFFICWLFYGFSVLATTPLWKSAV